jgi:aryl-alcohol dehydrogenase-like predicted oxidoreductase
VQHGIAFVAYSPLGRGFLGGMLTREKTLEAGDLRGLLPRFSAENFEANRTLLETLGAVASELGGASMSEVALAWVLSRAASVSAIPGTRSAKHLSSNAAAERLVLRPEQLDRLSAAFARSAVRGARYPEPLLRTVNT